MHKHLINFEQTSDSELKNLKLYRYYKTTDFIKALETKTLYLKKPHCWNDPFESIFLKSQFVDIEGLPIDFGITKERIFAQCWSLKEESYLMWQSYIPDKDGVKVEIFLEKLLKLLSSTANMVYVGKVKYYTQQEIEEYFNQTFDLTLDKIIIPLHDSLLMKRKEFSEEHEVRILFFDLFRNNTKGRLLIVNDNPNDYKNDYTTIPTAIDLFEKVTFHPEMTDKQISNYENILYNLGYRGVMNKSQLFDIPNIKIILDHKGKLKLS